MLNFFRTHLKNYNDKIICELLEFGAPIGFEGKLDTCESHVLNHIFSFFFLISNILLINQ